MTEQDASFKTHNLYQPPSSARFRVLDVLDEFPIVGSSEVAKVGGFRVGLNSGPDGAVIAYAVWPPGATSPRHSHACDYLEIVLEGSVKVGHDWFHAGDVRVVEANEHYGPLIAGPNGLTKVEVFTNGALSDPLWEDGAIVDDSSTFRLTDPATLDDSR